MPTMANVTVKKNDGTTDQVYTAVRGSQGPSVPAILRNTSPGTALAHKPEFWISSRNLGSAAKMLQEVKVTAKWPQIAVNSTTGVTSVIHTARLKATFELPMDMSTVDRDEFASQFTNVLASSLIKSTIKEGDAPV